LLSVLVRRTAAVWLRQIAARSERLGSYPRRSFGADGQLAPGFLSTHRIREQFAPSRPRAGKAHRKFVSQGRGPPVWDNLRGQIYLGSDEFIEKHAPANSTALEIPRAQRIAGRHPLASIVSDPKDVAGVARAYLECGYTQQEIADHLGVHYSTISRRVREHDDGLRRRRNT